MIALAAGLGFMVYNFRKSNTITVRAKSALKDLENSNNTEGAP